jgi:peptidoglycan/LPS O-acetylase OafA/YrhL
MRIPQIQALRAFAAILVVIYHAKIISGGYIGVDIFYVISRISHHWTYSARA